MKSKWLNLKQTWLELQKQSLHFYATNQKIQ